MTDRSAAPWPDEVPLLSDQLARAWLSDMGAIVGRAEAERSIEPIRPAGKRSGMQIIASEVEVLTRSELYWVSADMVSVWKAAADTLPPMRLDVEALPSTQGFAVLQEPLMGIDAADNTQSVRVDAISWTPAAMLPGTSPLDGGLHLHHSRDIAFINVTTYMDLSRRLGTTDPRLMERWACRLFPLGSSAWTLGHTWTDPAAYATQSSTMQASVFEDRRSLAALAQMLRQRFVVTERRDPNNAERKQAIRRGAEPSPVTLVTLRKGVVAPPQGERDVEWSKRWLVSAHWRNQWYPSTQEHRHILIAAYEKGPETKPLVVKPTVNVWSR